MRRNAIYGLLALLAAIGVGCSKADEPATVQSSVAAEVSPTATATPTPEPTPTPSATPTVTPTTTPLQTAVPTATSAPTKMPLPEATPPRANPEVVAAPLTRDFTNNTIGYSIAYPTEWAAAEQGESVAIVHPSGTQVVVTTAPLEGLTLDEFLATYLARFSEGTRFTETSRTTIDHPQGLQIDGILRGPGVFVVLKPIVTANGDDGLVAGSIASQFDIVLHQATLDGMLSSFKTFPPKMSSAADRGGLWAGEVEDQATSDLPSVAELFLTPGLEADVDPSRFFLFGLSFQCDPQRRDQGWDLSDCSGGPGSVEIPSMRVFAPAQEDTLQMTLDLGGTERTFLLSKLAQSDEPQSSDNVTLLWREPRDGRGSGLWAEDGVVFAPRFDGSIKILDATSGEMLSTVEAPDVPEGHTKLVSDVKVGGGLLFAGTRHNGLVIFDVTQPANPEFIGQYSVFVEEGSQENFTNVQNIFLSPDGVLVYVINPSFPEDPEQFRESEFKSDLRIVDVSSPSSSVEVGRFSIDTEALVHDVNVIDVGGRLVAFLNYSEAGLWILDVTDPASISVINSVEGDGILSHSGWPFALDGKLYYAHTEEGYDRHLTILDVTDLAAPVVVSRFQTRPGISVHNIQVVEGIAYIAYYLDGLRVVDLRDPENPQEIGHFDTVPARNERGLFRGASGVRVVDGVAYVADTLTGTYAIQVNVD